MTTTTTTTRMLTMLLIASIAVTSGCDGDQAPTTPPPQATTAAADALPADLFLDQPPAGAQGLAAAKKSAKPGDSVVVRGRVAGQIDPIAPNRAILTLLDPSVKTCDQMPGDQCKSPWDACCEPRESLHANTATIQVVDSSGRPLKTGLRGAGGIEPLKELTVTGQVVRQDGGTLIINATGIHVKS